jgi:hypothetical protein
MPRKNLNDYGLGENQDLNDHKQEELKFVFQNSDSPWEELEAEDRYPKVKLSVDINEDLDDLLAEKARELKKSKSELVKELLEWSLHK